MLKFHSEFYSHEMSNATTILQTFSFRKENCTPIYLYYVGVRLYDACQYMTYKRTVAAELNFYNATEIEIQNDQPLRTFFCKSK